MLPEIAERRAELADLCRRCQVRRLDLFGSATTGKFNPETSDLDFVVEFFEPREPREYARAFFALLEGLETLFERKIDLVSAETIVNPYFAQSVAATKETVYDAAA